LKFLEERSHLLTVSFTEEDVCQLWFSAHLWSCRSHFLFRGIFSDLERDHAFCHFLGEALFDLADIEADDGGVRHRLLDTHLNQCFFRFDAFQSFENLDSFHVLITL